MRVKKRPTRHPGEFSKRAKHWKNLICVSSGSSDSGDNYMKKKSLAILLFCLIFSSLSLEAAPPALNDYQSAPYWIAPRPTPMVLLVLSKDQKMFRHAYSPGDHDGDGNLDIGFNPETQYLGYHDSESCYTYNAKNGYFTRSGPATKGGYVDMAAPSDIPVSVKVPKNAHGVCNVNKSGEWHGNWLNFMMTSRIDAIKKVLYGGTRQTDTESSTVLEHSYIPRNAMVWGYDIMGDKAWGEKTPHLPYYNANYYLGVGKPNAGAMHFFARYTDGISNDSLSKPPLLHLALNIPADRKNIDDTDFRVWNWTVLGDGELIPARGEFPGIDDYSKGNVTVCDTYSGDANSTTAACLSSHNYNVLNARVQVCQLLPGDDPATGPPKGENCTQYPKNGRYKPTGLLQKYEGGMYFGLMTGTADSSANNSVTTKRKGGVIRHHIDSIAGAVNPETGILSADRANTAKNNIIRTMDKLTVTSWVVATSGNRAGFQADWSAFGNPMGEMLFEGVRYFAGLAAKDNNALTGATASFYSARESSRNDLYPASRPLPSFSDWKAGRRADLAEKCSKPVILMLSDIDNTFDYDDLGDISGPPLLPQLKGKAGEFPNFSSNNMKTYLDAITKHEGYGDDGTQYYFAQNPHNSGERAVCTPRDMDSLSEVVGLCPNEPSLSGSYSMAAVALYARTHNFSPDKNKNEPIDIYTVGVTPALPGLDFVLPASSGAARRQISISPTAVMNRDPAHLLSFIGYAIENWDTDDDGTPYRVRINVNYPDEGEVYVGWSDYEQDSTSIYEVNLLTSDASLPFADEASCTNLCRARGAVVIHSGPLKGYNAPAGNGGDPAANANAGKYFRFARKRGGGAMRIPRDKIAGLAVTTMILRTSTGAELGLGYTITGTENDYDGTYIDVSSNTNNNTCYPYTTSADGIDDWAKNGVPPLRRSCDDGGKNNQTWARGSTLYYDALFTPMGCEKPLNGKGSKSMNSAWCGVTGTNNAANDAKVNARNRMRILQTRSFEFSANPPKVAYLPSPMELAAKYGGFSDLRGTGLPDNDNPSTWAAIQGENPDGTANYGEEGARIPKNYFYVANLASLPDKLGQAFQAIANSVSTGTANSASVSEVLGGGLSVETQYNIEYEVRPGSAEKVKWLGNIYGLFVDAWVNKREDSDQNPLIGDRLLDISKDQVVVMRNNPEGQPRPYRYRDLGGGNAPPPPDEWEELDSAEQIRAVWNTARWLMALDNVAIPRAFASAARGTGAGRLVYSYFPDAASAPKTDGSAPWSAVPLNRYVFEPGKANNATLRRLLRCGDQNSARKLISYTLGQDQTGFRSRSVQSSWFPSVSKVWRLGDVMNSTPVIVGGADANYHLMYGDMSYNTFKNEVAGRRNMVYFGSNDGFLHAVNAGFYGSLTLGHAAYFTQPVVGDAKRAAHDLGAELWAYIPASLLPHLEWQTKTDFNHVYMMDLTPTVADMRIGDPSDKYGGWRTVLLGGLRLGGRSINVGTDALPEYVHSEYFALDVTDPEKEPTLLWRYSTPEIGQTSVKPMPISVGGHWYVVLASGPNVDGRETYEGKSSRKARVVVLDALTGQRTVTLEALEEKSFFNSAFMPVAQKNTARPGSWSNPAVYLGLSSETINSSGALRQTGALYRLLTVGSNGAALRPAEWKLTRMFNPERPITGAINAAYDGRGNMWLVFGTGRMWGKNDAYPCGSSATPDAACARDYTQYFYGIKEDQATRGIPIPNNTVLSANVGTGGILDVSAYDVYSNGSVACDVSALPQGQTRCPGNFTSYRQLSAALQDPAAGYTGYRRALNVRKSVDFWSQQANVFELINTQPQIDNQANGVSNAVVSVYAPSGDDCNPAGDSFMLVMDLFTGLAAPHMANYGLKAFDTGRRDESGAAIMKLTGALYGDQGLAAQASITHGADGTHYDIKGQSGVEDGITIPSGQGGSGPQLVSWSEVLDLGVRLNPEDYFKDLLRNK